MRESSRKKKKKRAARVGEGGGEGKSGDRAASDGEALTQWKGEVSKRKAIRRTE